MPAAHPKARLHLALGALLATTGCATPGLPHPPTLNLPKPPADLAAVRIGDTVTLRFTIPTASTDKLPLRGPLTALFCRGAGPQPCLAIPSSQHTLSSGKDGAHRVDIWADTLPPDLAHGDPHPLFYSVQILNSTGHTAGFGTSTVTAAGTAPSAITGLKIEGSRLGPLLQWHQESEAGSIDFQREDLSSHPALPAIVQLTTPPSASLSTLLDTTAKPSVSYRYTATRHLALQLGSHTVELRSAPSPAVDFTLHAVYAPPFPTGLTAASFYTDAKTFAVDLIWQPIDDAGLISPFAGYIVYRQPLDATASAPGTRLTPTPVALPAFHDTAANPATRYRYSVTAVDSNGNESSAAVFTLEPTPAP